MDNLERIITKKIKTALSDSIKTIVGDYYLKSPIGATGELKTGWHHKVTESKNDIKGVIYNTADNSRYRALGRKPGKQPPPGALDAWIIKKGLATSQSRVKAISYLIGRKIARKGTKRWQENSNPFKVTREGIMKPELKQEFIQLFRSNFNG